MEADRGRLGVRAPGTPAWSCRRPAPRPAPAAGSSSKAARRWSVASGPYSFSSKTRSRTSVRASGISRASVQQIAEEVDRRPRGRAARPRTRRAPGARPAHPQHVVEEQGVLVAGGEPLQLQIGPVQDDAAQPPGLGVDMESHASILTIGRPCSPASPYRTRPSVSRPLDDKQAIPSIIVSHDETSRGGLHGRHHPALRLAPSALRAHRPHPPPPRRHDSCTTAPGSASGSAR